MHRTNIMLSEEDRAWLLDTSVREGLTMSELIRRIIALQRRRSRERSLAALRKIRGMFDSRGSAAENIDGSLYGREKEG